MESETTKANGHEDAGVKRVSLRMPARLANRSLAVHLVAALVEQVPTADVDFLNAFTTAFGEAFNNVVIHAYKGRTDGMLDIEADVGTSHLTLRLMDTGIAADYPNVAEPDLENLPEGGLGVYMIHALVDEVVYRSGAPNVLSLTKRTSPSPNPSSR